MAWHHGTTQAKVQARLDISSGYTHLVAVCMHISYTIQSWCIEQYCASTHRMLSNYARKVSEMWHFVILWYRCTVRPRTHTHTHTVQLMCSSSGLRMLLFSALLITTDNIQMSEAEGLKWGVGKWVLQPHPSMGSKGILVDWTQPFTFWLQNGSCPSRDGLLKFSDQLMVD